MHGIPRRSAALERLMMVALVLLGAVSPMILSSLRLSAWLVFVYLGRGRLTS
jgi:hypothetical protein